MSNHDLDWLAAQQPQRIGLDRGARERALLALVRHTTSHPGRRDFKLGGVFRSRTFGFAAATGIAAIAAAVVLSTGGSGSPARPSQHTAGLQAVVHHHAARSPLLRLADYVSASVAPAGDATLVARTTATGADSTVTVYDLYADNGQYFFSPSEGGLQAQVSSHHNLAGGLFAREVAAAKLAATGNVQTAAQDMADAPDPSHVVSPTQTVNDAAVAQKLADMGNQKAAAAVRANGANAGSLYDNWVWENSQDALIAGAGQPQVRAGVLQILATLPGVTVTQGTSGGVATLVLTAGAQEMGYGYTEQLTINADSGVPIQFVGGPPSGPPTTSVDYKVSRVTLADLPSAGGSSDQS